MLQKTRSGLPKHCAWNIDRGGRRLRVRFRRNGVSAYLPGRPWSDDFMRAYAAAIERAEGDADDGKSQKGAGAKRTKPGTVAALVASYRELVFPTVEESTRRLRSGLLEPILDKYGDLKVATLRRHHVEQIVMLKAAVAPFAAVNLRKTLRHVFKHAVRLGWISHNPAADTETVKTPKTGGIHDWPDVEIEQYRERWPLGTKQRLALELALNTTARRGDMVKLQHECAATPGAPHGRLKVAHSKNKSPVTVPILPELRGAITAMQSASQHLNYCDRARQAVPRQFTRRRIQKMGRRRRPAAMLDSRPAQERLSPPRRSRRERQGDHERQRPQELERSATLHRRRR